MFTISKRPTISEIQNLYKNGKATPSQVTQFFFNRISEVDKKIFAFYKTTDGLALEQAKKCDEILSTFLNQKYISEEEKSNEFRKIVTTYPLFGIPFAIKSIILVEGEIFNAGSKILDGYKAPYSSTVYQKLEQSKAIMVGINTMDQFAMGSSGENSDYGKAKNPFDTERIPGGSSSGAAASVGSGQVVFSIGTDTGGSIRQPAAFCDVVGLKPTYGSVSRWGIIPMASSFDQAGPITNNIEDNILVQNVLIGKDMHDQTSIDSGELFKSLNKLIEKKRSSNRQVNRITKTYKPLKIGIPNEFYQEGVNPLILSSLEDLIKKLKNIGHEIVNISLPMTKYAVSVYYLTMSVEVAANLERIDGIRYAQQQESYNELYFEHRGKYFGLEAQRRIILGTYCSSAGYYDAYYNQAQKVRELARQEFEKVFEICDVILTPTTPEFPFKAGEKTIDPMKMYLSDIFTCGINPVKIPGISIPLGLFKIDDQDKGEIRLPTGCQLLAKELREDLLYELGLEIENLIREGNV
jgi:aspartyl-tRNA(Asn)/glutamyl-tRNA(Gln) amidotransferase subunit A